MSQPAMDANAFTELKELMGETFKDLIKMMLETLPQQLDGIKAAIEEQNDKNLFNISHKMKSSCGSIGAFGLAEKAEAIEIIGRRGSTDIPEKMLNDLHEATHQVISILTAELAESTS